MTVSGFTIIPDVITTVLTTPNYATTTSRVGTNYPYTLTLTTRNPIPIGGQMKVTLPTEMILTTGATCTSTAASSTCAAAGSAATISFTAQLAATTFTITITSL
jgi:hypothetical protein